MKSFMGLVTLFLALFAEVALAGEGPGPVLIGGRVAKPGELPEVVYISSGRSRCSATLVGSRTVLTAAHCIMDQGEIFPAEFVVTQQAFKAKCTHHPEYADKYSFDFAFCKTREPIEGVKFASIASKPVVVGQTISLMGYGATNPRQPDGSGGNGGNDGKLRIGDVNVTQVDDGERGVGGGQYFYTLGTVALGFGDSGGPAMLQLKNPKENQHVVIGVNSRGNIVDRSLLSATYLSGFQSWAKDYARVNEVEICGINKDCNGKPKPPRPRPNECIQEKYKVWYYSKKLDKWTKRLEQCDSDNNFPLPAYNWSSLSEL